MRNLLFCCLLLLRCPTASSQIAPLRPLVVQLDSGTTLRHFYVGLDSTVYNQTRRTAARVGLLEYSRTLDAAQVSQLEAELRRCRGESSRAGTDFAHLAAINTAQAALPVARPLLLSGQFYKGIGVGAVLLTALKIFLHY